jgi:hypothetical protein
LVITTLAPEKTAFPQVESSPLSEKFYGNSGFIQNIKQDVDEKQV